VHSLGQWRHGKVATETREILAPYTREGIAPTGQV